MSTTAPDYLTTLRDGFTGAVQQWMDQSTTAWDQWSQAWSPGVAPRRESKGGCHECREHHDCGCRDACDCCVPEADVVVHARAGELRVVPFRLHNTWRREREVSLEVGPWHGCSGDDLKVRAVLEEDKVVLGPCEDRVVRLLISTRGAADDGSNTKDTKETKETKDGTVGAVPVDVPVDVLVGRTRRTTDVTSCASAYADVRFEGCARPQRVAVVVLPADCDAVEVGCDCGCCC